MDHKREEDQNFSGSTEFGSAEETKSYLQLAADLKTYAISLLRDEGATEKEVGYMARQRYLDGIVAGMGHGKSVIQVLRKLDELKPKIAWYRGGTLRKFGDGTLHGKPVGFEEEDMETYTLDGFGNGVLDRKKMALGFTEKDFLGRKRGTSVLYSIPVTGIIDGLEKDQIEVVTEHQHDLIIMKSRAASTKDYLVFSRANLQIQRLPSASQ